MASIPTTSTAHGLAPSVPTGTSAGDLLILILYSNEPLFRPTWTVDGTYTAAGAGRWTSSLRVMEIHRKVAGSGEGTPSLSCDSTEWSAALLRVVGANSSNPIAAVGDVVASGSPLTIPAVIASGTTQIQWGESSTGLAVHVVVQGGPNLLVPLMGLDDNLSVGNYTTVPDMTQVLRFDNTIGQNHAINVWSRDLAGGRTIRRIDFT